MGNKRPPFESNTVFHIYNHGNAGDNIFREEKNYYYFLKRYTHYIYPVARTYAFCLLPNHFHFMIKVRERTELSSFFGKDLEGFENPQDLSNKISHQFGTLLNAYAKAFNNSYDRKGSLFRNTTKRKPVKNKNYYTHLIRYIHQNPVHHGFVKHPSKWPFSSYHIIRSKKKTQLERQEVLNWFGGKEHFMKIHEEELEINQQEFY